MIKRLSYSLDKLIWEINQNKIKKGTCQMLVAQLEKYMQFIERFASDLQFDNLELIFKIEQMEIEKRILLKWMLLNKTSEVLLNIIDESTLDFALENHELIKGYDFKDIAHSLQIKLWNKQLDKNLQNE